MMTRVELCEHFGAERTASAKALRLEELDFFPELKGARKVNLVSKREEDGRL